MECKGLVRAVAPTEAWRGRGTVMISSTHEETGAQDNRHCRTTTLSNTYSMVNPPFVIKVSLTDTILTLFEHFWGTFVLVVDQLSFLDGISCFLLNNIALLYAVSVAFFILCNLFLFYSSVSFESRHSSFVLRDGFCRICIISGGSL